MKTKLSKVEQKNFEYLIKAIGSAVNNTQPPLPCEGINWDCLKKIANYCSVQAMLANTVLSLPKEYLPDEEICKSFNENKNISLFIDGVLNYEIETILKTFDKYKIKNVPLKGYFIKNEYPQPDFRSVSDFDILFDRNQIDDVKKAFAEIGYEFLHNDDNQYHFQKKPYVYIEMHATLVHEYETYYPYLVDQIDHTTKRDGYDFSYEMSYEDHYVYMMVHNSNHLRKCGLGIRMVLDTYLYYKNHHKDFDMDYLRNRLKQFELDVFEERVRSIAFNWFSSTEPTITFDDFETYICLSATIGRVSTGVMVGSHKMRLKAEKEGKKKTKFSYFLTGLFPSKTNMGYYYPYVIKFPFLLPVSWFSMWFKRFFIEKNVHIKNGFKNRFSYTDEEVAYVKGILEEVGFDDLS